MRRHGRKLPPTKRRSDPGKPEKLGEHDGVVFTRERLAPILRELVPLLKQDWVENGIDHERVPLDHNFNLYLDYDLMNVLWVVTARDEGIIVGFVFALVNPHIDHKTVGWAIITWYWLHVEYRRQGIGRALMKAMVELLRRGRVSVIEASEKVDRAHGTFEKLGFKRTDVVHRLIL